MELTNTNDENSFDPTPRLKSSPIPINFVPFNIWEKKCFNCGEYYIKTHYHDQNYCKKCLLNYLTNITDNNIYLDVYVFTRNLECNEHEIKYVVNIMDVLDSYQIIYDILESEKYYKLCGKLYQGNDNMFKFKLCSDCYLISSGYVESALTKKPRFYTSRFS
ncbi:unnamed protein product [Rhizophagus irregularis]|nr:unnamed protein product [Rhizophagus irregularis]